MSLPAIKLRSLENVTEQYEIAMMYGSFSKMNNQRDSEEYNRAYECFAIHARNLARTFKHGDKVNDILDRMEKQIFTYPRKEPTMDEKVQFKECEFLFTWIINHYKVEDDINE